MGKLTDVQVRNWIKAGAAVAKADGDGLTFTLSANGLAAWILRYRIGGKRKELTLGRYPDTSIADARKLASEARARVQQGVDVGIEKQRARRESAGAWTVRQLGADYLAKAAGRLSPKTIKSRGQQLRDYVYPIIGAMPARDVSPADVVTVTERAAVKSLHVARLVLIAAREVFAHALARHVVEADPTAAVAAKAVIGQRPVSRARLMLTESELRAMFKALPAIGRANELAVKVLLSTCARIGELVAARWENVDFEARTWTIPPEDQKGKKIKAASGEDVRAFVVPLSPAALGWFLELKRLAYSSDYVLPTRARRGEGDRPMTPSTLNAALDRLAETIADECRRFTPHDLRSTARSHLAALGADLLIAERCLNHALGGLVAVYDQHDYMTERRAALDKWGAFLLAIEAGQGWNVVPMRRTAGGK